MANVSATVSLHVDISDQIPVGGSVLTSYPVPCKPADLFFAYLTSLGAGTAFYAARYAQVKGTAAAATATVDLLTVVCSDGTVGLAHIRELLIYNDDPTHVLTITLVADSFLSLGFGGTSVTITIQPGTAFRMPPIPLATNGYAVDATHHLVVVDPSTNTIAYRVIAIGD